MLRYSCGNAEVFLWKCLEFLWKRLGSFLEMLKLKNSNMIGLIEFGAGQIERHPAVSEVLKIYQSE